MVLGAEGQIEMIAGKIIITSLDNNYAELVKKTPGVALAGGINLRGRKIPKVVKKVSDEKQAGSWAFSGLYVHPEAFMLPFFRGLVS